jgi:hypothetical protein
MPFTSPLSAFARLEELFHVEGGEAAGQASREMDEIMFDER